MVAAERNVAVVRWPEEAAIRDALRGRRTPRLLVIPRGEAPPTDIDVLEDWVSASADAVEVEARLANLSMRGEPLVTPIVDDDDVLRVGDRWVALGPIEARVARQLVARIGEVVPRRSLELAAWGERSVRQNTTDRVMHRLRARMADLGLALVTVRGKGYVLEVSAST